ncbi:MAG: hypothetical protein IPK99_10145 [Flavobacteriales bacterium]|nr:hypothetical protein [Flavobacteriales bacterium]
MVVQPDGKTLGAGRIDDINGSDILVQRLMPDGSPDPSFGSGGMVTTGAIGHGYSAYAVGVQSTGKIIVAGGDLNFSPYDGNLLLVRYLADGTLDATFGNGGIISSDLNCAPGFQHASALGILPDDRIVIVGVSGGCGDGLVCARFTPDGNLDPAFGVSGVALTGVPASVGVCLHLNEDGSVIAGGNCKQPLTGEDWLLARFHSDGVLDPTSALGRGHFPGIAHDVARCERANDGRIAAWVIGASRARMMYPRWRCSKPTAITPCLRQRWPIVPSLHHTAIWTSLEHHCAAGS